MRKFSLVVLTALLLLLGFPYLALADEPPAERELVYAMQVFEGYGYASTFAPMSEDSIYLLADQDNALSPRYTMVYYWPITRSYRVDWNALNEPVEAYSLEILRGNNLIHTEPLTVCSVALLEGYGSRDSELYCGTDAEEGYLRFEEQRQEYTIRSREYYDQLQEFQRLYDEYTDAMLDEAVTEKPPAPVRPEEPAPFLLIVTPPAPSFRINLSSGKYRIRLKDDDGQIIPGSEKKLVVFSHRRTGIGYNIIPEAEWTKPERSDDPQETIYVDGVSNAALYLQPFNEAEFNEGYYRGLLDPQDHSGGEDRWVWAHLETYSAATLSLFVPERDEELSRLEEKPYFVLQAPGPRLGYQVVEYDPVTMSSERPTFYGFKVGLLDHDERLIVQLLDSDGTVVHGSEREIRWLPKRRPTIQYLWLSCPLLAGAAVTILRRNRTKRVE